MKKSETQTDHQGYLRYKDSNRLVHRAIAYKYIYKKNKEKYEFPFSKYQVHHKDGNKKNNHSDNLELKTIIEHEFQHGYERPEMDAIRTLVVVIFILASLPLYYSIAMRLDWSLTMKLTGFFIILFSTFPITWFVTRDKKGKKKIL